MGKLVQLWQRAYLGFDMEVLYTNRRKPEVDNHYRLNGGLIIIAVI